MSFQVSSGKKSQSININRNALAIHCCCAFSGVLVFLFTMYLAPFYVEGDQFYYINVYDNLHFLTFADAYDYYRNALGASEYLHFFLVWSLGGWVEKTYFISVANFLLAYFSCLVFIRRNANPFLAIFLSAVNYYMLVMYFPAERLKFAFIFLCLAFLFQHRKYIFVTLLLVSALAHSSAIIVVVMVGAVFGLKQLRDIFSEQKISLVTILALCAFIVLSYLMTAHLVAKYSSYSSAFGFAGAVDLFRIAVFGFLALLYADKKMNSLVCFIVLACLVVLLGGVRVNMFGYFCFLYFALPVRRGLNIGVVFLAIYFLFASIEFVGGVMEYGNAFYQSTVR